MRFAILWILKPYLSHHAKKLLWSAMDPLAAQQQTFSRLRSDLAGSGTSVQSGFENCHRIEDLARLPLSHHDIYLSQIHTAFNGLSKGNFRFFGNSKALGFLRTSGSLGMPKDIPLNSALLKSIDRSLMRMIASFHYSTGRWDLLFKGKNILLGSRPKVGVSPSRLPISDISGLIPTRTWKSLRWLYVPHFKDLWLESWDLRVKTTLQQALGKNIISISGIPALALDFSRRAEVMSQKSILSLWPQLAYYIYGASSLSSEEKKQLSFQWTGSETSLYFVETYFATEALLGFSHDPNARGMTLNLLENLYCFRKELRDEKQYLAHELELEKSYWLSVTTPGGLINYSMGDRIKVTSLKPLLIQVVGREKQELSMTGEKITLEQIDLTLGELHLNALAPSLFRPVGWIDKTTKSHLVWGFPETFKKNRSLKELAKSLDEVLSRHNVLYDEALNHEQVIGASTLEFIPDSLFESYLNSQLGNAQFKPQRLFKSKGDFERAYGGDGES